MSRQQGAPANAGPGNATDGSVTSSRVDEQQEEGASRGEGGRVAERDGGEKNRELETDTEARHPLILFDSSSIT